MKQEWPPIEESGNKLRMYLESKQGMGISMGSDAEIAEFLKGLSLDDLEQTFQSAELDHAGKMFWREKLSEGA